MNEQRNGQSAKENGASQIPQGGDSSSRGTYKVKQSPDFGVGQEGKNSNNSKTSAPSVNDIHIKDDENMIKTNVVTIHGAIKKSSSNEQSKTNGESGSNGRDSAQGQRTPQNVLNEKRISDN